MPFILDRCTASEFACEDGQKCIPNAYVCDSIPHCFDYSDERNCPRMSLPALCLCGHSHKILFADVSKNFFIGSTSSVSNILPFRFKIYKKWKTKSCNFYLPFVQIITFLCLSFNLKC